MKKKKKSTEWEKTSANNADDKGLTSKEIQMANRHMKRGSALLITREMQTKTKTIKKYHCTLVRTVIMLEKVCGEKRILLLCCLWECKILRPLWKTVWMFLWKLRITIWSSNPTPGYISQTYLKKDTCTPIFIAALIYNSQDMKKKLRCSSTDEWIRMWRIYTMEYYSDIKNEIPFIATWMQLEIIILSKVRKRKTNMIYHLHVESKIWCKWTC